MLALRSIVAVVVLPGSVAGWVPLLLVEPHHAVGRTGLLAAPFLAVGLAGLAWCVVDFATRGHGTLAPVDPPRQLVAAGLYKVVRNPMYVSVLLVLIGEALLLGSTRLAAYALAVAAGFDLFVRAYEEPALTEKFGPPYRSYCHRVGRWLPRRPKNTP